MEGVGLGQERHIGDRVLSGPSPGTVALGERAVAKHCRTRCSAGVSSDRVSPLQPANAGRVLTAGGFPFPGAMIARDSLPVTAP